MSLRNESWLKFEISSVNSFIRCEHAITSSRHSTQQFVFDVSIIAEIIPIAFRSSSVSVSLVASSDCVYLSSWFHSRSYSIVYVQSVDTFVIFPACLWVTQTLHRYSTWNLLCWTDVYINTEDVYWQAGLKPAHKRRTCQLNVKTEDWRGTKDVTLIKLYDLIEWKNPEKQTIIRLNETLVSCLCRRYCFYLLLVKLEESKQKHDREMPFNVVRTIDSTLYLNESKSVSSQLPTESAKTILNFLFGCLLNSITHIFPVSGIIHDLIPQLFKRKRNRGEKGKQHWTQRGTFFAKRNVETARVRS